MQHTENAAMLDVAGIVQTTQVANIYRCLFYVQNQVSLCLQFFACCFSSVMMAIVSLLSLKTVAGLKSAPIKQRHVLLAAATANESLVVGSC